MQLPRWNNCKNPRTRGKTAQPSISHSGQGLEGKKSSSLPVAGGIFSLTFPFIDQAIALIDHGERNGDIATVISSVLRVGLTDGWPPFSMAHPIAALSWRTPQTFRHGKIFCEPELRTESCVHQASYWQA